MEIAFFLKFIWAPFLGVFWWEMRSQRRKHDEQQQILADFRVNVAENYVNHKELSELKKSIEGLRSDIKDLIKNH